MRYVHGCQTSCKEEIDRLTRELEDAKKERDTERRALEISCIISGYDMCYFLAKAKREKEEK